ncbi:MAG: hypothetical protein IJO73_02400 [Clostridia bacterium]|nr:hypothetical protein [Clostridia bacterium]
MTYTADYLIQKRKDKWRETEDIEYDKKLRCAIGDELIKNPSLLAEVRANPEKLIEMVFIVVDKKQKTMPFFFNEVQRDFINRLNEAIEDFNEGKIPEIALLVLKGRQQGFTTLVTAYQLSCSILNKNFQGYTLADKNDNAEAIFQNKAKFPYGQLPAVLRPTEKFNNRKQLLFEKINSSWAVDTATKDVGRSRTVNFFHGSECAFWKDGIAYIQAALGEAFTNNCIKIYESTANGYNDYQKMWDSGAYINCFYEWWRTPEYRIPFYTEEARQSFQQFIGSENENSKKAEWLKDYPNLTDEEIKWIVQRLEWLKNNKKLDDEQLFWYWNKYYKYIDKDLIRQEYPCTPAEAFLLSGKTVFDTEVILKRLDHIPKPIKTGYFIYDYDGLRITNIKWVNDKNGYVKLYYLPNQPEFTEYCLGGDTAGDGSDFYNGHVLDAKTGMQVAKLKQQFDSDLYTKQMYCLGAYYKWALIGIETNFDTYPIMELQRLGYPKQYVREVMDTYTGKKEKRFGFKTTTLTRSPIIARLVEIVRDHSDTINDKETLEELLTIIKNKKGRVEAPEGGHDDEMMGLAIAHQIREQVVFDEEPLIPEWYDEFGTDVFSDGTGIGEKVIVI